MTTHAGCWISAYSTLHEAETTYHTRIEGEGVWCECHWIPAIQQNAGLWVHAKARPVKLRSLPVPRRMILFAIGPKQAQTHTQVTREAGSDFPVVLKIRLAQLVTLIVTMLRGVLRKSLNEPLRIRCTARCLLC